MKKYLFLSTLAVFAVSCNRRVKSEKGGIDIISNVYYNASKGLDDVQNLYVSKLNYKNHDQIIELVPNILMPEITDYVYFINGKRWEYFEAGSFENAKTLVFDDVTKRNGSNILGKKNGTIWRMDSLPVYDKRKNMTDTILFNKTFKRFEIESPDNYVRFYVHPTDTILPYSLNRNVDKDYKGRIERIDSYDKVKDRFATIMLLPRRMGRPSKGNF